MNDKQFSEVFSFPPASGTPEEEAYERFVESMVPHCHCTARWVSRPCDGVLAGGICDNLHDADVEDDPYDDDRVSLAYEEDTRDPMGLGGI